MQTIKHSIFEASKGALILESYSLCLHPPTNVPNHYPELEIFEVYAKVSNSNFIDLQVWLGVYLQAVNRFWVY